MRRAVAAGLLWTVLLTGCGAAQEKTAEEAADAQFREMARQLAEMEAKAAQTAEHADNLADQPSDRADPGSADVPAKVSDPPLTKALTLPGVFSPNLAKATFDAYKLTRGTPLADVVFAANRFVAVGAGGTVVTSPDGLEWTAQSSGTTKTLKALAHGNNRFVAVGSDGVVISSPDGLVWTSSPAGGEDFSSVTFNDGKFVAVNADKSVHISADGENWTRSEVKGATFGVIGAAHHQGRIVAQSRDYATIATFDQGGWKLGKEELKKKGSDLVYANGTFARAIDNKGNVELSADGSAWTSYSTGLSEIHRLRLANGRFVALAEGALAVSEDGAQWKAYSVGTTAVLLGIAHGNDRWVAVGAGGLILVAATI